MWESAESSLNKQLFAGVKVGVQSSSNERVRRTSSHRFVKLPKGQDGSNDDGVKLVPIEAHIMQPASLVAGCESGAIV